MNHLEESPKQNEHRGFLAHLGAVRWLILGFLVWCALLILTDLIVHRHLTFAEGELPIEGRFGFYAIYGFVAYLLIVWGSILLRKKLLRSEDYYDE